MKDYAPSGPPGGPGRPAVHRLCAICHVELWHLQKCHKIFRSPKCSSPPGPAGPGTVGRDKQVNICRANKMQVLLLPRTAKRGSSGLPRNTVVLSLAQNILKYIYTIYTQLYTTLYTCTQRRYTQHLCSSRTVHTSSRLQTDTWWKMGPAGENVDVKRFMGVGNSLGNKSWYRPGRTKTNYKVGRS